LEKEIKLKFLYFGVDMKIQQARISLAVGKNSDNFRGYSVESNCRFGNELRGKFTPYLGKESKFSIKFLLRIFYFKN